MPHEQTVDADAVARVLAAVPVVGDRRSKAVWSQALQRRFPSAERSVASEWDHGSRNRARYAKGDVSLA